MTLMQRYPVSLRRKLANRRNAAKSTGPRTAAGKAAVRRNAVKHGEYVRSVVGTMRAFEERPEDFRALVAALVESHRPATPAEIMLVEDLALLRWNRIRNEKAKQSLLLQNLDQMEVPRLRRNLEMQNETCDVSQAEVREKGLLRAPDSPAKFKQALELLELLAEQAERGRLAKDWESILRVLYGEQPSMRGAAVYNLYRSLTGKLDEDEERPSEWVRVSPLDSPPEEESGAGGPGGEALEREAALRELRVALLEEQRDVTEKYQLYLREQVEITPAMRNACLAPRQDEWRLLIRQESAIDRQIERKTRLLMQLGGRHTSARPDLSGRQPA